jgi:Bifunctional DNA primase/polymerase, N-terminal
MAQIFSDWQAAYAERGLATFPINPIADGGKRKLPAVCHYDKIGLKGSQQLALKFFDSNGIACVAGPRNRLTIIDIDARGAEADRIMSEAQCTYGRSRFIVRTGGGGLHAYYRHGGEGRKIRPDPSQPIDILGGGVVVLPPSLGAKQPYEIIEGHLDDLTALTKIKHAARNLDATSKLPPTPDTPRSLAGMREHDGRNDGLFDIVRRNGHRLPLNLEAFTDFARKQNAMCAKPMDDDEVVAVATSVLKYRMNSTLRSGGGVVTIDHAVIDGLMMENPDAYLLHSFLQRGIIGAAISCSQTRQQPACRVVAGAANASRRHGRH